MDFLTEVNKYESNNFIVLDFETKNFSKGSALDARNNVVLTVYNEPNAVPEDEVVSGGQRYNYRTTINWGNEYSLATLLTAIERADFIVAHNAKFELKWLEKAGLDLSKVCVFDTYLADYVLNGGLSIPLDLGTVASRYGLVTKEPYIDLCIKKGICPSELPKKMLERRCIYDVNVTHEIFLKQRERLRESGQLAVLWTRCILTPVLADIEKNGMALAADRVNEIYESTLIEFNDIHRQLVSLTGGINLNSPKQKAEFIYDTLGIAELKGKGGKPKRTSADNRMTDSDTLLALKGKSKSQREFLSMYARYAFLNARLSKSLNRFKECVDNDDIIHAQFNQARTKTQRLSSTGTKYSIQFQNQAREFKPLFKARNEGWLIAEVDGAQLEFRVAAFLGQDTVAVTDIMEGFDVHSYTASVMTAAGQATERQEAKAHTFKPLFGGKSGTKAEQKYYKAFREKYPGITSAQQGWIDEALVHQKVKTITGLIYHYPGTRISRGSDYVSNSTQICNYAVQGFATADIIPIALTYLWHEMRARKLQSFIVNTIHDSAVMEVHPDEVDIVREISVNCFTKAVYNYLDIVYNIQFNVPLGTGFKCGEYWTEGEEIVEAVDPPFKWSNTIE